MRPVTVAYDLVPEQITGGGIARYAVELRRALTVRGDVRLVPVGPRARRRHRSAHRWTQGLRREGWYHTIGLDRAARAGGAEVVHCPGALAPERSRLPLVLTVHDVLPLVHPGLFPRTTVAHQRLLLARRARRAARVIVNTRHVREEVVALLGVEPERVRVVPCGVAAPFRPAPPDPAWLRERFGLDRPYVLAVGTLEPRKNLLGAVRGLRAAALGDEVAMVVAGAQGWRNEVFESQAPRAGVPLVMTGRVTDEELVRLYSGARCLIFPSLYEGYGLPPLEAMACGCPVISSDRCGLPEVVDDAGVLVDPLDPQAIGAAIRALAADEARRAQLRERALARPAQMTWERAGAQTVDVYRELV
ncbi:MAG TPA: glycosyltransferase family 1 protein [Solirubrobacteraceae bacterium]|nr:glycosyltransferase family 1 protein [Solirubrobacteraceae bacterium]